MKPALKMAAMYALGTMTAGMAARRIIRQRDERIERLTLSNRELFYAAQRLAQVAPKGQLEGIKFDAKFDAITHGFNEETA